MRLIILLMSLFYVNSSYAFVAMIWDCKVTVPDSYMVDTRYESNYQSVSFQKHNFLDPSGVSFSVLENEIGVKQLEDLKESQKDNLRLLGEYTESGFLVSEYELPSLNMRFDIVMGKKQQVIFYGDAVGLWPSMIKGCNGGHS